MSYIKEDGIVIGNVENKYQSKNPIYRSLMNNFLKIFDNFVQTVPHSEVLEVGCGEGELARRMDYMGKQVVATDFSSKVIAKAQQIHGESQIQFLEKSIYDLSDEDAKPLVVCCEVLEHLEYTEQAMNQLRKVTHDFIILSVPREPLWRFLNVMRCKYLSDYGNTPGHLQHWSKRSFLDLVGQHFDIQDVATPIPWTICLCRKK